MASGGRRNTNVGESTDRALSGRPPKGLRYMSKDNPHVSLYLLNTALLSTHEIDSAFWKEWELFGLPLAAGGVFAFAIHGYFILTGHREFTLPVSMALLVAILVVSLIQGVQALKVLR